MNSPLELSNYLQENGVLRSPLLIESFNTIDRKDFVPKELHQDAYADIPLPIGAGQTISQPYTVAFMLELLELKSDDTVLDIGCGSGWSSALLAYSATKGSVLGLERIPELLAYAKIHIRPYHLQNLKLELASDQLGKPSRTFDKILVSAAAEQLPLDLLKQLRPNGIMVIPIRDRISVISKDAQERVTQKDFYGFRFVPLIY